MLTNTCEIQPQVDYQCFVITLSDFGSNLWWWDVLSHPIIWSLYIQRRPTVIRDETHSSCVFDSDCILILDMKCGHYQLCYHTGMWLWYKNPVFLMQAFSKTSMVQMILLSPIIKTLLVSGCPKFSNRIQLGSAIAACSFFLCFVETTFEWWHQPGLTVSDTFSFLKEHNEKVRRAETKTIADVTWKKKALNKMCIFG